ncbi:MAG: FAD-dependent oxidoreductase [Chloroflexi bacterium]|nr:FAD-dependent oxidoreductase [Chloroflexota bacterium]MBM4453805.1 FAD-dependent oxidoreductase [Chloroflexota bacterium]
MYSSTLDNTQRHQDNKPSISSPDHSLIPPCQVACPLHMDIREYVDLVAQGRIMEALQVIREGNPFPSICAYVCTHACESSCRRGQVDQPVAIRALKRFAVEFGGDRMIRAEAETTQVEKVAIVGSGPAGMACAYYLRKLGYPVTIFEAQSEIGGMLRVGIPQYRLPREVLDTEAQRLTQMGIEIRTNTRVVSLDLLFEMSYKAVFITIGAHQSLRLGIEGEDLPGVIDGATFLREVNLGLKPALGKKAAVVGGGNVAIDAARTALRLGTQKVTILYRRSRAEMPADPSEIEQALEEGIEILFLAAPIRIERRKGKLSITCIKMELGEPDSSGRRQPVPIKDSEFNIEVESLVTAIGQAPQTPQDFRLRIGRGSTIQVDPVTLTTNRPGIFAGGDAVTGPATVTEALAAGRLAALRIDDYLRHRYPLASKETRKALGGELSAETVEMIRKIGRLEPPILSREARASDFKPIELAYDWAAAVNEARRCLRCGVGAEITSQDRCASCLTCLRVCPYHVPRLDASGTIQIPTDQCLACGICVAECPAKVIVLRKPFDRRHIAEELDHALRSAAEEKLKPFIVGFCCQYGLFGTGALATLWREAKAGIWIVPVLCIAKVEADHILRAFELGAEGVFIAGCGTQCARENTTASIQQRVAKVRKTLAQIGLETERLQAFVLKAEQDPGKELDEFIAQVGKLYLSSTMMQEVRR